MHTATNTLCTRLGIDFEPENKSMLKKALSFEKYTKNREELYALCRQTIALLAFSVEVLFYHTSRHVDVGENSVLA